MKSKYNWLRWLPRALLLAATVSRAVYVVFYYLAIKLLGPKYWEWDSWGFSIPILSVTIIAWYFPIIGGILALVWIPVGWVFTALMSLLNHSNISDPALMIESVFLSIGGVLSILYGIQRRKKRDGE